MLLRRTGSYWSPWREMERLRREMNSLLATIPAQPEIRGGETYPAMNIWTNEDGTIVTAELPGFDPGEIDISVVGDTLTLKGGREPVELQEGATYHRRERGCGRFSRAFRLPFEVESDEVEAVFEKGVLRISLPRAEAEKPKKVTVKAS
jgi:HSP20 family protein